tara:strand:+ start:962 stop:1666 length:705 start_codon:yes stop_codon:yes gene_type:complete
MLHPLVSHKYKFICFWNAKCGCGTVKSWFLNLHGIHEWEYSPHSEINKHTPTVSKSELFQYPLNEYYKFIIVRNPWNRLVSYYKNKKILMRHKNMNFNINTKENIYTGDITFNELVNYINNIPDLHREDHVRSQFSDLDEINFDKIVKLENFHNDMNDVINKLNLPNNINFSEFFHQSPSPSSISTKLVYDVKPLEFIHNDLPSYEYFYNNDLINIVSTAYSDDIIKFNYKFKD